MQQLEQTTHDRIQQNLDEIEFMLSELKKEEGENKE